MTITTFVNLTHVTNPFSLNVSRFRNNSVIFYVLSCFLIMKKTKTNKDKLSDNSYHMHTFKPADMHNTFSIVSFIGLSQTETI